MCQPVLKAAGKAAGKVGELAFNNLPVVRGYNFIQDNWNRYLSPNRDSMRINNTK